MNKKITWGDVSQAFFMIVVGMFVIATMFRNELAPLWVLRGVFGLLIIQQANCWMILRNIENKLFTDDG